MPAKALDLVAHQVLTAYHVTRKAFTHSERVAIGEAIEAEMGERHGGDRKSEDQAGKNSCLIDPPKGQTRDLAAQAAGFGNGKTYEQAKKVTHDAAPELVQAMDDGAPLDW